MSFPTWQQVANRAAVTVQPTATVLYGPAQAGQFDDEIYVEVLNDDAVQTADCYFQTASASAGPWRSIGESLVGVPPESKLDDYFKVRGLPWWRVVGQSSGAGLESRITLRILRRG